MYDCEMEVEFASLVGAKLHIEPEFGTKLWSSLQCVRYFNLTTVDRLESMSSVNVAIKPKEALDVTLITDRHWNVYIKHVKNDTYYYANPVACEKYNVRDIFPRECVVHAWMFRDSNVETCLGVYDISVLEGKSTKDLLVQKRSQIIHELFQQYTDRVAARPPTQTRLKWIWVGELGTDHIVPAIGACGILYNPWWFDVDCFLAIPQDPEQSCYQIDATPCSVEKKQRVKHLRLSI
jgi:hypothetical protein